MKDGRDGHIISDPQVFLDSFSSTKRLIEAKAPPPYLSHQSVLSSPGGAVEPTSLSDARLPLADAGLAEYPPSPVGIEAFQHPDVAPQTAPRILRGAVVSRRGSQRADR